MNWRDFVEELDSLEGTWAFRGGLDSWEHETTLDRARRFWGIPSRDAAAFERCLIREFQRHPEAPVETFDERDALRWFAFMQHHGAPTRLLDWTYSPYVASYFAFDALFAARQSNPTSTQRPIVWALGLDWLAHALERRLSPVDWRRYGRRDAVSFRDLFVDRKPPLRFVGAVTPIVLNHRLSIQQGVFLCPGDVRVSWADNLRASSVDGRPPELLSFVLRPDALEEAFETLTSMNVTARSLFPGADGYAKWVAHRAKFLLSLAHGQ
jgi:hypothetical protein